MTTTVWTKTYRLQRTATTFFSDDLLDSGPHPIRGVSEPLTINVIPVQANGAFAEIEKRSNGTLHKANFEQSELRHMFGHLTEGEEAAGCLINNHGCTVLVEGRSFGWVTIVTYKDTIEILCHGAFSAAMMYIGGIANRYQVPFYEDLVHDYFSNELSEGL